MLMVLIKVICHIINTKVRKLQVIPFIVNSLA